MQRHINYRLRVPVCVSCAIVTLSDWLANTDSNRLRLDDRMWESHTNCSICLCVVSFRCVCICMWIYLKDYPPISLYTVHWAPQCISFIFFHFPSLVVWMYFMLFGFHFVSFSFMTVFIIIISFLSVSVIFRGFAAIEMSFLRVRFECSICISGSVTFLSNKRRLYTIYDANDDGLREFRFLFVIFKFRVVKKLVRRGCTRWLRWRAQYQIPILFFVATEFIKLFPLTTFRSSESFRT